MDCGGWALVEELVTHQQFKDHEENAPWLAEVWPHICFVIQLSGQDFRIEVAYGPRQAKH